MADKLNQSLDEILKDNRRTRRPRPGRRSTTGTKGTAPAAPVGGVKKPIKTAKPADKAAVPTGPAKSGESKIIVSNLPTDVSETMIKDYFHKTIGPVKKVLLTYGPNGQSRGVCTIIFVQSDSAAKAAKEIDGVKVDGRAMKVEVIVGAKQVPAPTPAKDLSERISKPKPAAKAQPKPATAAKATAAKNGPKGRPRRGRNPGRPKAKTAEELDTEMQEYWGNGTNEAAAADGDTAMATNGGAVQPAATSGDTGMEDEIM